MHNAELKLTTTPTAHRAGLIVLLTPGGFERLWEELG